MDVISNELADGIRDVWFTLHVVVATMRILDKNLVAVLVMPAANKNISVTIFSGTETASACVLGCCP